ncbi:hypothetical protein ABZX77_17845 [Streptomyces sp. NPDC004237]|uniref:hypothetical protein n=1 Tax=Streptomyces sp. NPDC004237 TaxID=3154455 RepID=UPI0033B554E8
MKALLLGAVLGLLWLLFPSLLAVVGAVLLAAAVKALPPTLVLVLAARTVLPRVRRWAR